MNKVPARIITIKMSELATLADYAELCGQTGTTRWATRYFQALYNRRVKDLLTLGYLPTWDSPALAEYSVGVNVNSLNFRAVRTLCCKIAAEMSDSPYSPMAPFLWNVYTATWGIVDERAE